MCKVKTSAYTPPPTYARAKEPNTALLQQEARAKLEARGGSAGAGRLKLTGLNSSTQAPVLGAQTGKRMATALG